MTKYRGRVLVRIHAQAEGNIWTGPERQFITEANIDALTLWNLLRFAEIFETEVVTDNAKQECNARGGA